MYRTSVKYENFNGVEKERTLYFNLTNQELAEMKYSTNGDFEEIIEEVIKNKDYVKMLNVFEELVKKAYGEKSEDGEYFDKSEEVFNRFKYSNAYDAFMNKLMTKDDELQNFVFNVIPKSLSDEAKKNAEVKKKIEELIKDRENQMKMDNNRYESVNESINK